MRLPTISRGTPAQSAAALCQAYSLLSHTSLQGAAFGRFALAYVEGECWHPRIYRTELAVSFYPIKEIGTSILLSATLIFIWVRRAAISDSFVFVLAAHGLPGAMLSDT